MILKNKIVKIGLFAIALSIVFGQNVFAATSSVSEKVQKIEVLSPSGKGGTESFKRGEVIRYTYKLAQNTKKLEVSLHGGPKDETVYKVKRYDGWGTNAKIISKKATANLEPGEYVLLICDYTVDKNDPICDASDGTITITGDPVEPIAESLQSGQKIEIISPNGGETYNRGDSIFYTYKLANNSKNLEVKLLDDSTSVTVYSVERYDGWGTNTKIISKKDTAEIPVGKYRLQICDVTDKGTNKDVCDMSSTYFSIIGKNITDNSAKIQIISPTKNIVAKRNTLIQTTYKIFDPKTSGVDIYLVSNGEDKKTYNLAKNYASSSTFSLTAGLNPMGGELKNGSYSFVICPVGVSPKSTDCASFKVEITGNTSSIKIVAPKGGEVFGIGNTIGVDFAVDTIGTYQINLGTSTKGAGDIYLLGTKNVKDVKNKIETSFVIPSTLTEGTYFAVVELLDTDNSYENTRALAQSRNITLVKRATSTPPATNTVSKVTVTNPSGGEVYKIGQSITITWDSENVADKKVKLELINLQTQKKTLIGTDAASLEAYSKVIASTITPGSYKVVATLDGASPVMSKGIVTIQAVRREEDKKAISNPTDDNDERLDDTYGDKQGNETRKEETRIINGAPTDACKNLPGDQSGIPSGYTNVGVLVSGNCKKVGSIDEFSESVKQEQKKEENKKQEQKTEKVCQILKTTIISQKFQQKEEEWKTVKCDGDVFKNTPKKDKRIKEKKVETEIRSEEKKTTAIPKPTNAQAVCSASGDKLSISWTKATGYDALYFRLSPTNTLVNGVWKDTSLWKENTKAHSEIALIKPGVNYSWWIHTRDGAGNFSDAVGGAVTCTPNASSGTQSASESIYSSIDLEMGMAHSDVISLQQYLNSNGYAIESIQGEPGSKGYESNYFGEKTKQALIKFQTDKGISPAKGFFGRVTREAMGI